MADSVHRTFQPPRRCRCGLALILAALSAPVAAWAQTPQEPTTRQARSGSEEPPASASAAPPSDPRIDATGRDRRIWPPDPLFDHLHLRLEMTIPDMSKPAFRATETLELMPVGAARTELTLDAGRGLTFSGVTLDGAPVAFTHDPKAAKLTITFPRPLALGQRAKVQMTYVAIRPGGGGDGLTFSSDDSRTPEVDFMCHAQGQPQNNHLWFPCHDFPNERLSTELIVDVPDPYEAVSNGRLVSVTRRPGAVEAPVPMPSGAGDEDEKSEKPSENPEKLPIGRSRFHWKQELPHPAYLMTLVVSRFDVVNVGGPDSARPGLWMPVYGPLGAGESVRRSFANTPKMIAHFEELFGLKYPWDKYAQILCRDFAAGAMENTGTVTFAAGLARGRRAGAIDDIIAHELVHHWFGDLITCRSWEHLWLNEGWATFGEALWVEHLRGRDGYLSAITRNVNAERMASRGRSWPRRPGMVTNRYTNPDQRFTSGDNVYQKGGVVLHMLRQRLGDEVFFAGVRAYVREHRFDHVETDDFRFALEQASGQSLERFFEQWCIRPGHPELQIDYTWTPDASGAAGTLSISVEQKQKIDADNPAYAFNLPFYVNLPTGASPSGQWTGVLIDSRSASGSVSLPAKPESIEVDPDMSVLARVQVRQELSATIHQLEHGSTSVVRERALWMLDESDDPAAARAIAALAARWSEDADPLAAQTRLALLARQLVGEDPSGDRAGLAPRDDAGVSAPASR